MNIRSFLTVFILSVPASSVCLARSPDEKVLMKIAGREVQAGEFTRMYLKSKDPENNSGLDDYLELFIIFKLKVADALALGYDTTAAFRNELGGYREQLARNYLTDTGIKEKILREAYQRSLTEINASHILVSCPANALPEDTLKAFMKAKYIRDTIVNYGKQFDELARLFSDDKSAAVNGGNLGYFTAFRMIKPFEDAAYSSEAGEISMPVRTSYGYHIIRVADKRPSKGRVKVAHIMKTVPPGAGNDKTDEAEAEIKRIYEMIGKGSSFSELASKFSDHKESAVNGGELEWFGTGEMISDFSKAAFALCDSGDYSKPVRSPYGFHIIMLLGKKPPGSYEESRSFLESKISPSYISSMSRKSVINRLKTEYDFKINPDALNWFAKNTDTLIMNGKSNYDPGKLPAENMYSFADQSFTTKEFAAVIENKSSSVMIKDPGYFIRNTIGNLAEDHILKYENSNLEKKYPDFRYLMNEFHDGILLFDISSEKVWNRSQEDTTGLRSFYNKNKTKFRAEFEEVRGDMIAGFQEWLMLEWIEQLRKKYPVEIESQVYDEVRRKLTNE